MAGPQRDLKLLRTDVFNEAAEVGGKEFRDLLFQHDAYESSNGLVKKKKYIYIYNNSRKRKKEKKRNTKAFFEKSPLKWTSRSTSERRRTAKIRRLKRVSVSGKKQEQKEETTLLISNKNKKQLR